MTSKKWSERLKRAEKKYHVQIRSSQSGLILYRGPVPGVSFVCHCVKDGQVGLDNIIPTM